MGKLDSVTNENLIANLKLLKSREDSVLLEVLEHVLEIEKRQLFLSLGFPSLYAYMTQELGYSDGEAYRRIESARLMGGLPEIKEEIAAGRLNVTNMSEVRSAIKAKQKIFGKTVSKHERRELVSAVLGCSKKEAQKNLAEKIPELSQGFEERQRIHGDGSLELTLLLLPDQRRRLERARDLLAHKGPLSKNSDTIDRLSEFYLKKKDLTHRPLPSEEALRHKESFGAKIPIELRRQIFRRDHGRCQFKNPQGKICGASYQIEIDHILPISRGGTNAIENLRCLCRAHNQWKADRIMD